MFNKMVIPTGSGEGTKEITNGQIVTTSASGYHTCSAEVPEGAIYVIADVSMVSRGASATPFNFSNATEIIRWADSYTSAGQGSNPVVRSFAKVDNGADIISLSYDSNSSSATFVFLFE